MDHKAKVRMEMSRHFDFRDPAVGAAFDIAHSRVSRRTIEISEPTGKEATRGGMRGERENYPGLIPAGSQAEIQEHIVEMQKCFWDRERDHSGADADRNAATLRAIGISRGYHLPRTQVETRGPTYTNAQPEYMTSYDKQGNENYTPVYGGGQTLKTKYANTPIGSNPVTYGGTLDEGSKHADLPDAPRLPNGELDYQKIMEWHKTPQPSGRQAGSYIKLGLE
jgi:hypothetical protein